MDQEEAPLPASEYPCCIDSLNSLPLHEQGSASSSSSPQQHHDPEIVASTLRQNSIHRWSLSTRTIAHYCRLEQIGEGTYGQVYRAQCLDRTLAHPDGGEIVALKKIRLHHPGYWGIPPTVLREIKILKQLQHKNLVKMFEVVSSKGVEELDWEDEREDEKRKKAKESSNKSSLNNNNNDNSSIDNNMHKNKDSNTKKDDTTTSNATTTNNNNKPKKKKDAMSDIDKLRESYKGNLFLSLEYISHDLTGLLDMAYKFSEVQVKSIARQLLQVLEFMHERNFVHRDLKVCSSFLLYYYIKYYTIYMHISFYYFQL
jgi:serine/threonine protein kinase